VLFYYADQPNTAKGGQTIVGVWGRG